MTTELANKFLFVKFVNAPVYFSGWHHEVAMTAYSTSQSYRLQLYACFLYKVRHYRPKFCVPLIWKSL